MKHLFSNVFNKHLYAFACTLFFFLSVNSNADAQSTVTVQCQNGLTMTLTSDLTTHLTAIPFGTPITITTTVTNSGNTSQTVNLQLSLNPTITISLYNVLCAEDYFWNGSIGQRNNILIGAGQQVVSRMRVVYNLTSVNDSPAGGEVQATLIANSQICNTPFLTLPIRNTTALPIGTPGQTTTINSFQPNSPGATGSLIVRGNVILNINHIISPVGNSTNAYIYMDEGATLTIPNGRTLILQGVSVFGIRAMWNSIIVESGGTLIY